MIRLKMAYVGLALVTIGSVLPMWANYFVYAADLPAWYSLVIGIPILTVGAVLVYIAEKDIKKERYPEVLERTPTPIPLTYLLELEKYKQLGKKMFREEIPEKEKKYYEKINEE